MRDRPHAVRQLLSWLTFDGRQKMKAAFLNLLRALYPLSLVVAGYVVVLGFSAWQSMRAIGGSADLFGTTVEVFGFGIGIAGVSVVLLAVPMVLYLALSRRSVAVATAAYAVLLFLIGYQLTSFFHAEDGFGDIFEAICVSIIAYGVSVVWVLKRPTFFRVLPAVSITIAALTILHAQKA
jgi:hypothetical protein